ncbi:hypothetical protein AZE42_04138 [Rhizopogon vesiculosus]|uniref:UBC core domain-containing protein n=1 Tax=Rhizopogon vesiculosus TaxID=180088 RepID=A0A1J8R6D7_9AGAM|nr:hypothetical protein AZE42_04138 [Rhizopogon vesiculosus]
MAPTGKPLKGRKRFNADLRELNTSSDFNSGTWSVQGVRAGEDDGSVEFELVDSRDQTRIVVHLLCSDTSEYPDTHSIFCHSPEPGSYGEQMKDICDEMLNASSSTTILEVAKHFLVKISGDEDDGEDGLCDDIGIDEDDMPVFDARDDAEEVQPRSNGNGALPIDGKSKDHEDWVHDMSWVEKNTEHLLPPPVDSTPGATMALQKEFKGMMKEQANAEKNNDLATLGWYMPPEFNGENLYQWVIEMHSFDPSLPIAKDMASRGINSLVFETRFPPTFPHSPPFFRLVMPRFVGFAQGGGGHVTIGGSICMDLLTSGGWLPSYNIAAILLQIRLAISSNPPARIASDWNQPYQPQEALQGYTRAATAHGWKAYLKEMQRLVTLH